MKNKLTHKQTVATNKRTRENAIYKRNQKRGVTELIASMEKWKQTKSDEDYLALLLKIFEAIYEEIEEGGSYRYLIYDRLGLGPDAYQALYPVGMNITNALHELCSSSNDLYAAAELLREYDATDSTGEDSTKKMKCEELLDKLRGVLYGEALGENTPTSHTAAPGWSKMS